MKLQRAARRPILCLALMPIAVLSACHHQRDGLSCGKRLPCGAIPAPLGSYSCQWQDMQAAKADADDRVVYQADWIGDSDELGPQAQQRLARAVIRWGDAPGPILVAASDDEQRDERRCLAVWEFLAGQGLEIPAETIVTGYPEAAGLEGPLAEAAAGSLLRGTSKVENNQTAPFPAFGGSPRAGGDVGLGVN